jgi:hypothetical protein
MIQFPQAERGVVRWAPTILLALTFCAVPLWLWGVPLRWFFLKSDDFTYLGQSRTASMLWSHLVVPHNGHVAPLFLLETHLLAWLAGSLELLPAVLSWASYATLVLAMAATGHVVAWETGRPALGLAAMAAVGLTSVLGPTLLWYAASQALAAGTMIVVMLAALQVWRARGSLWPLALAVLASIAAPLFWSAGYAAGLVAMAYLWADGRRACRRVSVLFPAVSVLLGLVVWRLAGSGFALASHLSTRSFINLLPLHAMVAHSAQAACEALILNNLGLDAATTAGQAIFFGAVLIGIWAWSRRRSDAPSLESWPRVNPLEAAGAVLVVASFGMIFAARDVASSFDGLRTMGWYDAMAELGAVLFAFGWWSGPIESPLPRSVEPPRRLELLVVMLFAIVMLGVQSPRIARIIYEYDGSAAPFGPNVPIRATPRTAASLAAQALSQRRALAVLDRLERTARETGMTRATIRQAVTPVSVPGFPLVSADFTVEDLLDLPDREIPSSRSPGSY